MARDDHLAAAAELLKLLHAGGDPEQLRAAVEGVLSGRADALVTQLGARQAPALSPVPAVVRGFRVRLDLVGAKPPIWRRLLLPGDLTLPRLHDVVQAAMGWTDSHLHRFRTGRDHRSPAFLTPFDVEEGEEGMPEDGVRFDQLVAEKGDGLWYEYDFGDGWEHQLLVEEVLAEPPAAPRVVAGKMACPPEDCGGIHGYLEIAAWVRADRADSSLPQWFEDREHALTWLPPDWHPDEFDVEEADAAVALAAAEPVPVVAGLADLVDELERRSSPLLRHVLARPASHGRTSVTDVEASRLTETYHALLEVIGDGVTLTAAGFLPPAVVEQVAVRTGVTDWWIGKANREDLTPPVAQIRDTARDLGLLGLRKGRLTPTAAARRCGSDPQALWRHVVGRLPVGRGEAEEQASWLALAVVGSEAHPDSWHAEVGELMFHLGWRRSGGPPGLPSGSSATLDVLAVLGGVARNGRSRGADVDPALAATARAVIRRA